MVMKELPLYPYLRNIVSYFYSIHGHGASVMRSRKDYEYYVQWMRQFGFEFPATSQVLKFPDDFSDEDLMMFKLRWL
jgi:hypothetical protein